MIWRSEDSNIDFAIFYTSSLHILPFTLQDSVTYVGGEDILIDVLLQFIHSMCEIPPPY